MPDTNTTPTTTMPEETATPDAPTAPAPKQRKPREVQRSIETLDTIAAAKMTPNERITYINVAREYLSKQNATVESYKNNCEKAFEQYRNADKAYNDLKAKYNGAMQYVQQLATVLKTSVDNLVKGI